MIKINDNWILLVGTMVLMKAWRYAYPITPLLFLFTIVLLNTMKWFQVTRRL